MNDHPLKTAIECGSSAGCLGVGVVKWLDAVAVPEFLLWGGAILLVWQLWRAFWPKRKRDRSQDGTHY